MQVHTIHTYTINEHPDPDAVYQWIRENWHDLGDHAVQETVDSLEAFASAFDLALDYSISIYPVRGEHIGLCATDSHLNEISGIRLYKYLVNNYSQYLKDGCPFTGVCYDEDILDPIRAFLKKPDNRSFQDLLDECGYSLLSNLHKEGEYIYSDEGLHDTCEANEYQFTESGSIY